VLLSLTRKTPKSAPLSSAIAQTVPGPEQFLTPSPPGFVIQQTAGFRSGPQHHPSLVWICRRNKAKPRRIQHHRRAVTGGDVRVLGGGRRRKCSLERLCALRIPRRKKHLAAGDREFLRIGQESGIEILDEDRAGVRAVGSTSIT